MTHRVEDRLRLFAAVNGLAMPPRITEGGTRCGSHGEDRVRPASALHGRADGGDAVPPITGLSRWYQDMAAVWLSLYPLTRQRLVLRTHRWVADQVLAPMSRGEAPSTIDLRPGGRLAWDLFRKVPRDEAELWDGWIRMVLVDLARALAWPEERRTDAWLRWLFLIPYSLPVPKQRAWLDGDRWPITGDRRGQ
jgi:hypothetical protein